MTYESDIGSMHLDVLTLWIPW